MKNIRRNIGHVLLVLGCLHVFLGLLLQDTEHLGIGIIGLIFFYVFKRCWG